MGRAQSSKEWGRGDILYLTSMEGCSLQGQTDFVGEGQQRTVKREEEGSSTADSVTHSLGVAAAAHCSPALHNPRPGKFPKPHVGLWLP